MANYKFKKGDKVKSGELEGVVIEINKESSFPISVKFSNGVRRTYKEDGYTITLEEGAEICESMESHHDCSCGMSWDIISDVFIPKFLKTVEDNRRIDET